MSSRLKLHTFHFIVLDVTHVKKKCARSQSVTNVSNEHVWTHATGRHYVSVEVYLVRAKHKVLLISDQKDC